MSNIWRFSSSSEPLVRKLIETANTLNDNNKWSEKFRHVTEACRNYFSDENTIAALSDDNENLEGPELNITPEIACEIGEELMDTNFDADFCNCIEAEPVTRFDFMMEECLKHPNLINALANHLSVNAIEKIFDTILLRTDVGLEFVSIFIQMFFPIFLKREQSWLALDLLLKTNKAFPESFKPLLIQLMSDVNIPSNILQELLQSSVDLQKEFLGIILHINFTEEMFKHHLYALYIAYKDCIKTETIQNFMQTKLIENAPRCSDEKNYGRLLLTFLQAQKGLTFQTNCITLQRVIEQHKSSFKRPCMTVLNEISERTES